MKIGSKFKNWLNPRNWFKGEQNPAEQMGLGLSLALFVLALISFFRGNPVRAERLSLLSAIFAGLSLAYPRWLLPLEKILRNLVFGLAWLNTKLMLVLVYYFLFTPIGILLKIFGKKLLEREFRTGAESYFEQREEKPYQRERDELQF